MDRKDDSISPEAEVAARCHEIQVSLGATEVPEFELLTELGMAVRLALHIRGLPIINYDTLRLVANHYLYIPTTTVRRILLLLAEAEFVKLDTEGKTIKTVLSNVPYYEDLYYELGAYAKTIGKFNEGNPGKTVSQDQGHLQTGYALSERGLQITQRHESL